MSSYMSTVITGDVYPGVIDPRIRRKWVTDYPYGPPIEPEKTSEPAIKPPGVQGSMQPKRLGDETHFDMANLLKKLMVTQKVDQITKALPQHRDWR